MCHITFIINFVSFYLSVVLICVINTFKMKQINQILFVISCFVRAHARMCVCVCVCNYTMCQGRTLCIFYTCKVRTFDQEQTHSRSAVNCNLRFGLVTLENLGIDHKIMGVAWVHSWCKNYFLNHIIYMNKNLLLVKITYILVSTSHAYCWPFKYWWSALSSKVCKKLQVRPWLRSYVCVCVCVCVFVCRSI